MTRSQPSIKSWATAYSQLFMAFAKILRDSPSTRLTCIRGAAIHLAIFAAVSFLFVNPFRVFSISVGLWILLFFVTGLWYSRKLAMSNDVIDWFTNVLKDSFSNAEKAIDRWSKLTVDQRREAILKKLRQEKMSQWEQHPDDFLVMLDREGREFQCKGSVNRTLVKARSGPDAVVDGEWWTLPQWGKMRLATQAEVEAAENYSSACIIGMYEENDPTLSSTHLALSFGLKE